VFTLEKSKWLLLRSHHIQCLLEENFQKTSLTKQLPHYCNSIVLDFFMQKPIAQWVVYIIIFNWKGLNDTRSWWWTSSKQLSLRILKLWDRLYLLNYSQWLDNNVHVFFWFNLGPSANNLPIEGGFIAWDFFCCRTKWNSGWISQTPWPKVKQGFLQMLGKYQLLNIPIGIGIEIVLKNCS
jgi:hypothetical protein